MPDDLATPEPIPGAAPGSTSGSTTEPTAQVPGRDRLVSALKRPSRSQITAAVLLGLLGFAGVVQVQANDEDDRYAGASQQDLIQLINSQQLAQQRVEQQITQLEGSRDALQSDTAATQAALELARSEATSLGILAGTSPAVGPGIRATVDGPPGSVGAQALVNGIQELRDAGAEAMEVNDTVRLVGQSAISDGPGDSVIIDGQQLELPFVIEAIGNPAALDKAVFFAEGFAHELRKTGGDVTVRQLDRVDVTTTRPATAPEFARPVEGGSGG
jgi:uncharacterized protein YlxW (UPF0749 family)